MISLNCIILFPPEPKIRMVVLSGLATILWRIEFSQDSLLHDPLPGTLECVSKHVGSEPRDAPHVVSRVSLGLCFGPMVQHAGVGPRDSPRRDTNSNYSWVKRQRWCRETGLGGPNMIVRVVRLRLLAGTFCLRDVSIFRDSLKSSVDTLVLRAHSFSWISCYMTALFKESQYTRTSTSPHTLLIISP